MGLFKQLALKKDAVFDKWFARVIDTYPDETARFLRSQKDAFSNPVGQATVTGLKKLIDLLDGEPDTNAAKKAIDPIVRIRAVQNFTPSQAIRFVFDLKSLIRAMAPADRQASREMVVIDNRIDELALLAFDLYMSCREKIYDLTANETKKRTYSAFARAGLIKESGDE